MSWFNISEVVEAVNSTGMEALDFSGPWVWYLIAFYLSLPLLGYVVLPFILHSGTKSGTRTISIFVLGDLGHSPRMCYHARSFAELGYSVNLCGYLESELPEDLIDHPGIDVSDIPVVKNTRNLPFILFAFQKIGLQMSSLLKMLFEFRGTNYIMIQNPPSIPILVLVIAFIRIFSRNTQLIIDWHNLNYSILNLRYKNEHHPLVRILKLYEKYLGRWSDLNLTVTKNMKLYLVEEFGLDPEKVIVLYDRPGNQFSVLDKLEYTKDEILSHEVFEGIDKSKEYKIIISSTSFTPDEDFGILLDALKMYDQSEVTTPLLLIVTGKGPLKSQFLQAVDLHNYSAKVVIKTAWLAIEDYPVIMAVADLGVSLHTSSSGLDLPMKILDFFGCGIPVVSLNFASIPELVKDKENGLITAEANNEKRTQATEVFRLIKLALSNEDVYSVIKAGAMKESELRWRQNWKDTLAQKFKFRS